MLLQSGETFRARLLGLNDKTAIFVIALLGAPVTMVAWSFALGRLNKAVFALRGGQQPKLLQGSVLLTIVAFLVWFAGIRRLEQLRSST